jgi:hypothetical protein
LLVGQHFDSVVEGESRISIRAGQRYVRTTAHSTFHDRSFAFLRPEISASFIAARFVSICALLFAVKNSGIAGRRTKILCA